MFKSLFSENPLPEVLQSSPRGVEGPQADFGRFDGKRHIKVDLAAVILPLLLPIFSQLDCRYQILSVKTNNASNGRSMALPGGEEKWSTIPPSSCVDGVEGRTLRCDDGYSFMHY